MRLERIEVRRVDLPLRAPFETSFGRTTAKRFLLVSVSADGVTGHAECVADADPFYLPETNDTVFHVLRDFLAPMAFSLDLSHPREVAPALSRVRGHEMAKASLEMAVWELWARRASSPERIDSSRHSGVESRDCSAAWSTMSSQPRGCSIIVSEKRSSAAR